jgi:hypothetical protein
MLRDDVLHSKETPDSHSVASQIGGREYFVLAGFRSLCFIPIIDSAVRARAAGHSPRTRGIIVYSMNALARSQNWPAPFLWRFHHVCKWTTRVASVFSAVSGFPPVTSCR